MNFQQKKVGGQICPLPGINRVNTNNYDYIYKAVDRRRGPEDEPIRRESRRVGGKRPGDHPVIQEEAAGEETRR